MSFSLISLCLTVCSLYLLLDPVSAGEVRDRVDQYKGIGTSLGASDPFESYRRNKSQTYIKRIKDARQ